MKKLPIYSIQQQSKILNSILNAHFKKVKKEKDLKSGKLSQSPDYDLRGHLYGRKHKRSHGHSHGTKSKSNSNARNTE